LEASILENEYVKATVQLRAEPDNSVDPLVHFEEINFEEHSEDNLSIRISKFLGRKILKVLFPLGVHYHSGQFDVLHRALRSGSPMIFVNFGKIKINYIFDKYLILNVFFFPHGLYN
jgi:hypothetical protein